jgi:hypothetical protein
MPASTRIEQEQARVQAERAADLEPALLAVREIARFLVGECRQADEFEDRGRPFTRCLPLTLVARRMQHRIEHGRLERVVQVHQHVLGRGHLANNCTFW